MYIIIILGKLTTFIHSREIMNLFIEHLSFKVFIFGIAFSRILILMYLFPSVFFFSCRYITLLSSTASHISAQCHCISAGHQLYTLVAGVGSLASVPLSGVPLYNRMWCHHHSNPICSYCICIFQLSFSVC